MSSHTKMKDYIESYDGEIILTRELLQFGSRSTVTRAVKKFVKEGFLYKMGLGIYAKAKDHGGFFGPRTLSLSSLATEALDKLGIKHDRGYAARQHLAGRDQMPGYTAVDVYDRKITRKIGFGENLVIYEHMLSKSSSVFDEMCDYKQRLYARLGRLKKNR